jgi:hypothetical protein
MFVAELEANCRAAAATPELYPARRDLAPGLRMAVHGRYLVRYRDLVAENTARIERVLHDARYLRRLLWAGACWCCHLSRGLTRGSIFVGRPPDQHLALADMVRRSDDALFLHLLDQLGGAVVADVEMPLNEAGARLALARHHGDRLGI